MTLALIIAAVLSGWSFMLILSNERKRAEQEKQLAEDTVPANSAR